MSSLRALNFKKWIDEHRHLLKPPVGNQQIWADREFMVTVVGGPNARRDFHVNEGEEFFYQLEGDINLHVLVDGKREVVPIREGEIFLLPPNVPHSPQRPPNTIGLVLERRRRPACRRDQFLRAAGAGQDSPRRGRQPRSRDRPVHRPAHSRRLSPRRR